jgi:hypothetical protein
MPAQHDAARSSVMRRRFSSAFGAREPPIYADSLASVLSEGDIIIFKGKHFHDAMIRCCTRSEWNHVGMVVRTASGELELFEASALGVGRVPLEFYINSYYWSHMRKQFHKIVIRQLFTNGERGITRRMRTELVRYQVEVSA